MELSIAHMKIRIDPEKCAGTGACAYLCPEVFEMVGGHSRAKETHVPLDYVESVRKAMECCPTKAIVIEEA